MDSKDLFIVFIGILLFIDGIYSVPVSNEDVKQRLKRQSEDEAEDKSDSDTDADSDDLAERITTITDTGSKLIEDLLATLESSARIIRDIIEAKRKIAEPLLEGTAKALETLSESKAIERTLETVQTVATAGLQASTGITTALAKAGESTNGARLVQGITSVSEIGGRVIRLAICTLICPIQSGDERKTCQKDNCGKIDRSDNLDYYDGDFEEDFESSDDV